MTFTEVFQDLMDGNPITRAEWLVDDAAKIVFYNPELKLFVDRQRYGEWMHHFLCVTADDLNATDWEVGEWEDSHNSCVFEVEEE